LVRVQPDVAAGVAAYVELLRQLAPAPHLVRGPSAVSQTRLVRESALILSFITPRLDRFLILGSEGGAYYATEQRLTKENAVNLAEAIAEDGARVVARILAISESGRAPKVQPAIFALAACAGFGDDAGARAG
jgi:hypothetical protein